MAEEWSLYVVLQADGALREPAYRALHDLEFGFGKHPQLKGCVDLIDGDRGIRYIFHEQGRSSEEEVITDLACYLKHGCQRAFSQSQHRKTCMIFSGHGSGIVSPIWDQQKQKWVYIPDEGNSPFSRYCASQEYAFLEKIVQLQDQQLAASKSLFLRDSSQQALSYQALGELVAFSSGIAGKKIDMVGFDACSMAFIDVAYDLKDHARYLIASQTLENKEGWCYKKIVEALSEELAAHRLVRRILFGYEKEQRLRSVPLFSLSAFDLAVVEATAHALDDLVDLIIDVSGKSDTLCESVMAARFKAAQVGYCGLLAYIDLSLFLDCLYQAVDALLETADIIKVKEAIMQAREQLRLLIISQVSYPQSNLGGCLVYFPHAEIHSSYCSGWESGHCWRRFLDFFVHGLS
jgi:hypothetical protein